MNTSAILSTLTKALDYVYSKFTTNHFLMSDPPYSRNNPLIEITPEDAEFIRVEPQAMTPMFTVHIEGDATDEDKRGYPAVMDHKSMLDYAREIVQDRGGVWFGDVKSLWQEIAKRGYQSNGKTPHATLSTKLFHSNRGRQMFRKLDGVIYLV